MGYRVSGAIIGSIGFVLIAVGGTNFILAGHIMIGIGGALIAIGS